MKKKYLISKKAIVLLLSLSLLVTAALSTTLAYLVSNPVSVVNSFTPAHVDSSVVETISGTTKNNVKIQNDGDIPAYIRAKVVFTWQKTEIDPASNKEVVYALPAENDDYNITWTKDGWAEGQDQDGFYYYNQQVPAGETTDVLFTECSPVANKAPEGYSFCVEILCDAIQAEPANVVTDIWGFTPPTTNN